MLSRPIPQPKPSTRLAQAQAEKKARAEQARVFRAKVWSRDRNRCVVCHKVVKRTLGLDPLRGEVHHILTRGAHPDKRYDVSNGVLTCLFHHLQLQRHEIELPK